MDVRVYNVLLAVWHFLCESYDTECNGVRMCAE